MTGDVFGGKIDHQADRRQRLERQPSDAEVVHFDQSGELRRRPCQQASVMRFEIDAIVGDQTREGQGALRCGLQEIEGEPRLAGAGGTADQHGGSAGEDDGGVGGGIVQMTKRALVNNTFN